MDFELTVPQPKTVKSTVSVGAPKTEGSKTNIPIEMKTPDGSFLLSDLGISLQMATAANGPILEITVSHNGERIGSAAVDVASAIADLPMEDKASSTKAPKKE